MKDINYREEDWQEAKSALAPFTEANWWGGLFNNLEDVSKNMEVAEEDILDLDSDRAISFQHKNYQDKYGEIEDDLKVLHKFSSHAGERIETLIDEPFYKKLDAFVDGMQDLSITTYSTTNRIGAKSTQTYTTSDGTSQVIESVKENATIEDLMNGDNFYANQMNLQYEAWKRANPDQDVSEADFKMGMLHTRAFDYKSIKDKQEEKEFWVNIVATVVMVGVSIVCPPAGLALGIGYGALEASSAITGKDWISGRELSNQERLLRGGFALLDIIPGVKAFSSGAKIASTGSKMLRVGDDLLGGGKLAIKNTGGTIDNGVQVGKRALDVRIPNVKKVTDSLAQEAKKKLTQDLDDIGTAAKTIQANAKEAFQMPSRERLAFAGVGDDIAGPTATETISAAKKKIWDIISNMSDLNIKGSGTGDIIGEAGEKFTPKKVTLDNGEIAFQAKDGTLVRSPDFLDEAGDIKWPKADGFVVDKAGNPIMVDADLKAGQIIDRYGNSFGKFTSPVEDGNILAYDTRGLPYPESVKTYHQYEVVTDINLENVQQAFDDLSSIDQRKLLQDMKDYEFTLSDIANPQTGEISKVFGAGGGTQIQLGTVVNWYEKMNLLKEIK
ncbi:glycohydrolase toxin TNT-related protein [Listeria seeligeri]|uniref:glycohydrolase toxin TNT-related protein n=1 Tax=Listeria seeligeri TaxID=1640 RepID=UPI001628AB0C|nr:glycohydrolase toxin TNT-related protein [Listeria seeligeri]MBC1823687.1 glycohydrolase toxin TNT-related protein [Listeria seeligeri]MBC1837461.1 glycohydrolase toxin TNT-related protein [Listeria seeligeri]MBF2359718.1 glycohydrolase toxin TNT-related protein [Listeria seeligeri]MBF2497160.1 glycohydrolase toxin TNT-related protein [Listeria seeligeri]MBF2541257.1 glycohydrolase toxin TNT-related protein [Listeria seeligeri]